MQAKDTRSKLMKRRGYRDGIRGDTVSLYISNYPATAEWLAKRIGNQDKVCLELCCGVGVTLEYLAPVFKSVIGVDYNLEVLNSCKENLKAVGLLDKVTLIEGDVRDVNFLEGLKADVVIYDTPYWYPENYSQYDSAQKDVENPDLVLTVKNIQKFISKNIVICVPSEMSYDYFNEHFEECEYVQVYIGEKYDRNYVFLGDLVREKGAHPIRLTTSD